MLLLQKTDEGSYNLSEIASNGNLIDDIKALPTVDLLVTGAHQDDEAFTFFYQLQAIEQGKKVGTVIVTDGAGMNVAATGQQMTQDEIITMRNLESMNAAREVGIDFLLLFNYPSFSLKDNSVFNDLKATLKVFLRKVQPAEILTHSPYDDHLTHLLVAEAVVLAAKNTAYKNKNVRGYPVWGSLLGKELGIESQQPLYISPQHMQRQSDIFRRCYPSQTAANDYPTAVEARAKFQRIMYDAHQAAPATNYLEFFVDYKPLTRGKFKAGFKYYAAALEQLHAENRLRTQEDKPQLSIEERIEFVADYSSDIISRNTSYCL